MPSRRFSDISKFQFFFGKNEKKNQQIWFKLSQPYDSTISFCVLWGVLSKNISVKKILQGRGGGIAPTYLKIMYYLTIAIINKCFKFYDDWLKIICIRTIACNFCPIPLCLKKSKISNSGTS